MRKCVKKIVAITLTMMLIVSFSINALAVTRYWSAAKTPGVMTAVDMVDIPMYKGEMTFKVTELSGNCSYLLGKCVSANNNLYYIDNASKSLMITLVGGEQSFYMGFINGGDSKQYMYLNCSVEHNASISQTVVASGKIYF